MPLPLSTCSTFLNGRGGGGEGSGGGRGIVDGGGLLTLPAGSSDTCYSRRCFVTAGPERSYKKNKRRRTKLRNKNTKKSPPAMVGWWTLSYVLSRSGIIPIRPGKRAHESCTTVRFSTNKLVILLSLLGCWLGFGGRLLLLPGGNLNWLCKHDGHVTHRGAPWGGLEKFLQCWSPFQEPHRTVFRRV